MGKCFMGGSCLGGMERMMMDPSRTTPAHTNPWRKGPRKKLPCDRPPVRPHPSEQAIKGDGVYDENLEGFYDYRRYGEQHIRQEGGQFNECGYVAYQGVTPLEELMQAGSAAQHQQEPQMGGFSC